MKRRRSRYYGLIPVILVAAGLWFPGMRLFARQNSGKQTTSSPSLSRENTEKTGEQVFMENCSRCHRPPMTISPRTTGTIVMHMRVRAKLSRQDERILLQYLAP